MNGSSVSVEVKAYDINRTTIRVQAEKYLSSDNATAGEVMDTILRHLQEK